MVWVVQAGQEDTDRVADSLLKQWLNKKKAGRQRKVEMQMWAPQASRSWRQVFLGRQTQHILENQDV